ncbi:MAG: hypothetical protein GXC76_14185 [Rhodanobacteraceae bacterium]|jgi:hypothetical protein|nr:hypothetical protein [Rhodanobacteraceae bacterium]
MDWHASRSWLAERHARLLLLTDSAAAWRFRRTLAGEGFAILRDDGEDETAVAEAIARLRPHVVVVSPANALRLAPTVFAWVESNRGAAGFCLFHVAGDLYRGMWLHGSHPQLFARLRSPHELHSERQRLANVVALVRFLQCVRHPGMPVTDFIHLDAWFEAAMPDSPVVFASQRLPKSRPLPIHDLRSWLHRMRIGIGIGSPCRAAFCLDMPFDVEAVAVWDRIRTALDDVGIASAFGAIPARERLPDSAWRLSAGFLAGRERT